MGTREVYEEKLRSGNLHHDPTINPGLGSPRCPRCLSLVDPSHSGAGEWTITPVLHDMTAVFGTGVGAMLSAVHGFNTGIPFIQKHVKGPKWLQFTVGLPPFLFYSAGSAAFGGYALPKFAQLSVTSYYAASSASHYGISQITRLIEDSRTGGQRAFCSTRNTASPPTAPTKGHPDGNACPSLSSRHPSKSRQLAQRSPTCRGPFSVGGRWRRCLIRGTKRASEPKTRRPWGERDQGGKGGSHCLTAHVLCNHRRPCLPSKLTTSFTGNKIYLFIYLFNRTKFYLSQNKSFLTGHEFFWLYKGAFSSI